jgi:hypothetical protein
MLMWLFLLFFGIGLVLTIAGFALDLPLLNLVGTIMLFLMGMTLLQDGLDYKVSEDDIYVYGNNFSEGSIHWDELHQSDYPNLNPSDDPIYLFHKYAEPVYDSYDDAGENRFGWLLMAMGALLFCLSLFRL